MSKLMGKQVRIFTLKMSSSRHMSNYVSGLVEGTEQNGR